MYQEVFMNKIKFLAFVLVCCFIISCSVSKEKQSVDEALSALRKIEAATQVGVSYEKYGELLIEAKAKVNEATKILPPGDLSANLFLTMKNYEIAQIAWRTLNSASPNSSREIEIIKEATKDKSEMWAEAKDRLSKMDY